MRMIEMVIRCVQVEEHAKKLRIKPEFGIERAMELGALLDGSSEFYIHKPGPGSPIGKCALCGAALTVTTEEREITNA